MVAVVDEMYTTSLTLFALTVICIVGLLKKKKLSTSLLFIQKAEMLPLSKNLGSSDFGAR